MERASKHSDELPVRGGGYSGMKSCPMGELVK